MKNPGSYSRDGWWALTDHDLPIGPDVDSSLALSDQEREVEAVLHCLTEIVRIESEAEKVDPLAIGIHSPKD